MQVPTYDQVNAFFDRVLNADIRITSADLYHHFYEFDFVLADFDWADYQNSLSANHPAAILLNHAGSLSLEQRDSLLSQCHFDDLFKILTAVIRGDLFCDGLWRDFVTDGSLLLWLKHLAVSVRLNIGPTANKTKQPFAQEVGNWI